MDGDDWTVVGSKGRPRKPRRPPGSVSRLSDKASGSPAAATRGARRSAEAPADGGAGDHGDAAQQDVAEAGVPLPGWGSANGHGGAMNGRAGRAKRRQGWVEHSPAEKVGVCGARRHSCVYWTHTGSGGKLCAHDMSEENLQASS